MRHIDEIKEMVDEYVESEEPRFWTNPDVPSLEEILDNDGKATFDCPYFHCTDDFEVMIEDRASFRDFLKDHSGTFRCEKCDEPIFGLFGHGDQ